MVYIYLPSPCYTDGNSFRFCFFSPSFTSSVFLPLLLPFATFISVFTLLFLLLGLLSQSGCLVESEMCQRSPASALIPTAPFLCVKLPRGSRPLVWVYYQNILTKYWVSATRISCCGRLTEWPLSLRTLMQQRAALSGGNLPPRRRTVGHIREAGAITIRAELAAIWSVTMRTIISQSPWWKRTMCQKTRCTSIGAAPLNSLPPGSKNIIYILLFICRQIFCGSAGTRFQ